MKEEDEEDLINYVKHMVPTYKDNDEVNNMVKNEYA